MSSPASNHIQQSTEDFGIVDRDAALVSLENGMDAVPDLVRIVQLAKTIFGEDTEISLRRDRDPDGDSEYLVVGIRTVLEPAQAHNLLSRLREEWWAIAPSDIEDQILVANEFL